jgi:hypothetical protein
MERFLDTQEKTLHRLLEACAVAARTAAQQHPSQPTHPASAGVLSSVAAHATEIRQRAATAPQPLDTSDTTADVLPTHSGASQAPSQHRAHMIAELLQRDKESQWAATVGRTAAHEKEQLTRAVALEEERLALAQKRNAALRARLSALKERHAATQCGLLQQPPTSTALMVTNGLSSAKLALMNTPILTTGDYTNEIVEARRQLDQCTRELQESQEHLQQLQQYHLDQLSGQFRPLLFAEDALRTTENFLDTETNMAVRATVVDALLEVNQALKPLLASDEDSVKAAAVLPCLESISSLWDRIAVQNFVVGRINRLFTCMCPTAPPLTLLKDTNMM